MKDNPLVKPDRLWSVGEVSVRPSPIPAAAGVYGWRFTEAPHPALPTNELLYIGIAPRHMATRTSTQNLRTRLRYHLRGNAAGSTLRLTLGCLLGLELRRVGSGTRLTFAKQGEAELTSWIAKHARLCWTLHPEPWLLESELIRGLDLPLNLDQNGHNAFQSRLKAIRADARAKARDLPIVS